MDPSAPDPASGDMAREDGRGRSRSPVRNQAFRSYDQHERRFYKAQPRRVRQRIADTEERVVDLLDTRTPMRFKVLMSDLDDRLKAMALKKVDFLANVEPSSAEFYKVLNWVEGLCALPIGRYRELPVSGSSKPNEVAEFLNDVRTRLDDGVHGHTEAKSHIVRLLARWITNPTSKGLVLGVHGQMGTGKTSLCKVICECLGLPFAFVPLGGANDGCYMTGHSYTYEGATWGKLVDVLMRANRMNPVIMLDELDKVSEGHRGQEIIHTLIHMTDPAQNHACSDKYFTEVELDLSRSLIIFSYNDESKISPILRDRMTTVHTDGYGLKDKMAIVRQHLLPGILSEFGMTSGDMTMGDEVVGHVIHLVEEEQGVRNLRRGLTDIISSLHLEALLAGKTRAEMGPCVISVKHAEKYVVANRRGRGPGTLTGMSMYT